MALINAPNNETGNKTAAVLMKREEVVWLYYKDVRRLDCKRKLAVHVLHVLVAVCDIFEHGPSLYEGPLFTFKFL